MAPSPFRRRKAAMTVRNLAIAEAALAMAKDRAGHSSRRPSGKLLLLGGAVAVAGAAALWKRDKVAGLLPSRSSAPEPAAPPPPQPSNYDAAGPVANTATPIPAPDPQGAPPPAIDEAAEEAAAAAEAGAIGGRSPSYAGTELGERATEAERPLAEAGEGEAEGQEQAEAQLADNATYRDAGMTDTERQIEDTIEQAGQPQAGETPEPAVAPDLGPASSETDAAQPPATPGGGISGRPFSGLDQAEQAAGGSESEGESATSETASADVPAQESLGGEAAPRTSEDATTEAAAPDTGETGETGEPTTGETGADTASKETGPESTEGATKESGEDEDSDDWRTWSGRAVKP